MIEWIKENIGPPGIDKKNRFSIFKTIGDILGRVKSDAVKAHNAHFPYLSDDQKLEEHGKALSIPHLMHDKPDEFRNRVAAASFFLMRAGSRGFIMDLLKERFGDRVGVVEQFLQIQTTVDELTNEEQAWIWALLDALVDPNVLLGLTSREYIDVEVRHAVVPVLKGRFDILAAENYSTAWIGILPVLNGHFDILSSEEVL